MRNHDGVLVLDSEQARNHVRRRLQPLPYSLWRPLAHLLQYARVRTAIRSVHNAVRVGRSIFAIRSGGMMAW